MVAGFSGWIFDVHLLCRGVNLSHITLIHIGLHLRHPLILVVIEEIFRLLLLICLLNSLLKGLGGQTQISHIHDQVLLSKLCFILVDLARVILLCVLGNYFITACVVHVVLQCLLVVPMVLQLSTLSLTSSIFDVLGYAE